MAHLFYHSICPVLFFQTAVGHANEDNPIEQEPIMQSDLVQAQFERIDFEEIKVFWDDIATKYGGFLPESQKGSLMDFVSGEKQFSFSEWFKGIAKFVFHELLVNGKLLGSLILLTIFSMFLQALQNAFEQSSISKVAYAIVYMVLIILALNSFHVAIEYTKETIDNDDFLSYGSYSTITCVNCYIRRSHFSCIFSSCLAFFNEYERDFNSIRRTAVLIFSSHFKHC